MHIYICKYISVPRRDATLCPFSQLYRRGVLNFFSTKSVRLGVVLKHAISGSNWFIYIHIYTYIYIYIHIYIYTHTHTHTHTHKYMHIYTHTYTYVYA